jgi:large subunit ribosomal protein L6
MSRVGKFPIAVPSGVDVQWKGLDVMVKGPKGSLSMQIPDTRITLERDNDVLRVNRSNDDKRSRAFHGLVNRLISNMITGVTTGFKKELELRGVGYRAQTQGENLVLSLGYSHPIVYTPPKGVKVEAPEQTRVIVSGIDKQAVGQAAANIRGFRPPEPYKGKGVRHVGEYVRMLEGKKSAKA